MNQFEIIHWHGMDFAVHKVKPLIVCGEFAVHDTIYPMYSGRIPYTLTHVPSHRLIKDGKSLKKLIALCERLGGIKSNYNNPPPEFDRSQPKDLTPPVCSKRDEERHKRLQWLHYNISEEEKRAVIGWMYESLPSPEFIAQAKEVVQQWEEGEPLKVRKKTTETPQ